MKALKVLLVTIAMITLAACGTSGIKTEITQPDGTKVVTTVGADVAAIQAAAKVKEAEAQVLVAMQSLDSHAQTAALARGDLFSDAIKDYMRGEAAETAAIVSGVKTIAGIGGAVIIGGKILDVGAQLASAAGDTYNTKVGDISVAGGSGPAGGEGGGDSGGSTTMINISGQQAGGDVIRGHGNVPYYLQDSAVQNNEKGVLGDGDFNDADTVTVDDTGVI